MINPRASRPLTLAERARLEALIARLSPGGDLYERAEQRVLARDRVLDNILGVPPCVPARERYGRQK